MRIEAAPGRRRHVDFVYSAELRVIGNVQLAEEVSWYFWRWRRMPATRRPCCIVRLALCTTHNHSVNAIRGEVRRRAREEKAAAMNELLAADREAVWESVAPHLDDALSQLSEPDRDALLLRYFQRKSAREMAQALGISGEAAQKRVNRAVERLRDLFAKRGIAVGANALVVLISANAVKAAPAGLCLSICAAAVSGVAVQSSMAITTAKIITMTTIQKALVVSAVVALVGTGIYKLARARYDTSRNFNSTAEQHLRAGQPRPRAMLRLTPQPMRFRQSKRRHPSDRPPLQNAPARMEVSNRPKCMRC
jgi:RNA polymerase sigma factor (sigma-70 family)